MKPRRDPDRADIPPSPPRPPAPTRGLPGSFCPGPRVAHRCGVIMGALVAFPAAAVDAREAGEAQLGLIVLQGLVSDHARA